MQLRKICMAQPGQGGRAKGGAVGMANDTERRVIRVLEHIHAHPAADLSLDALAEVAAMSRFH